MKKIIVFVFTVIMVSSFSILLAADAPAKLEAKLKAYFSEKISTANITTVKVVKLGDIYRAKRQNMFNNNIVEDIERPVLVNIKGKCKYSAKIIDENVKQILHRDEWGEWAIGQGTMTESSVVSGLFSAAAFAEKCPDLETLTAYNNGTVVDKKKGLMWAAKDNGKNISWLDAKSYCENYRGGGYSDWRMPTQDELAGLYDEKKTQSTNCVGTWVNVHFATMLIDMCFHQWASETRGSEGANFSFFNGDRNWGTSERHVLPVRFTDKK